MDCNLFVKLSIKKKWHLLPETYLSLRNTWGLKRDTKDWPSNTPEIGFSRPLKASHWWEKSEQWWLLLSCRAGILVMGHGGTSQGDRNTVSRKKGWVKRGYVFDQTIWKNAINKFYITMKNYTLLTCICLYKRHYKASVVISKSSNKDITQFFSLFSFPSMLLHWEHFSLPCVVAFSFILDLMAPQML